MSALRPDRSLPPGKTRYPLYRRLGGPQGRSGHVRKISPPPGFDHRTVQPVAASRYTDYATRPTDVPGVEGNLSQTALRYRSKLLLVVSYFMFNSHRKGSFAKA